PLVFTYVDPDAEEMTTNTIERIYGVKRFVNKWKPTYRRWYGEKQGDMYAEKYFTDVISRLAKKKLASREYSEMCQSIFAVLSECSDRQYAAEQLTKKLIYQPTVKKLPRPAVDFLKFLLGK
ncbi:MAG: hypothetical protein ABEK59_12225, partial [Halobacteria archaeon]